MLKKIILLSWLTAVSCSQSKKYQMSNMLGGEDPVDVTKLVVDHGFKPIYDRQKNIRALLNPDPAIIGIPQENQLKAEFKKWLQENNPKLDLSGVDTLQLSAHSSYQYSYLITDDPVDVYKTEVKINDQQVVAYFRMEKGNLMFPYKEEGWIIPAPVK